MRCNEVYVQARLRITCLPGSHQRPGDLGNSLGLGSITFSHVQACHYTSRSKPISFVLSPHCVWSNITSRVQEGGVRVSQARV